MFHTNRFLSSTILCALLAVPLAGVAQAQAPAAETKRPNAPDQKPAFEGQTRAPQAATQPSVEKTVVADGLPHLWSMEFLPDGRMIVAAKEGAMHIVTDGKAGPAIAGVPEVASDGQGGLLDIALAPVVPETESLPIRQLTIADEAMWSQAEQGELPPTN